YDLAKRTKRELADVKAPAIARFADGERAIAIAHGDRLTLVDVASGRQRELAAASPIGELVVSGPIAYWNDARGALWKLDVIAGSPEAIVLGEPVRRLAASPDGRWIALASDAHLL